MKSEGSGGLVAVEPYTEKLKGHILIYLVESINAPWLSWLQRPTVKNIGPGLIRHQTLIGRS